MVVLKIIIQHSKTTNQSGNKDEIKSKTKKYNLESLTQESVQLLYKLSLALKVTCINTNKLSEIEYEVIKIIIHQVVIEALGRKEEDKRSPE